MKFKVGDTLRFIRPGTISNRKIKVLEASRYSYLLDINGEEVVYSSWAVEHSLELVKPRSKFYLDI